MSLRTLLLVSCATIALSACSSTGDPNDLPLYGNYENVDNQSLCMGIMAFAADFPKAVWPGKSKGFYGGKKNDLGIKSAALFKIAIKKYGKQDAAERGITGYSSAKSLAYVLGGDAITKALDRCETTVAQALEIDGDYDQFLDHLGETPANPAVADIIPQEDTTKLTSTDVIGETSTPVIDEVLDPIIVVDTEAVVEVNIEQNIIEPAVDSVAETKLTFDRGVVKRMVVKTSDPSILHVKGGDLIAPMADTDENISAGDLNAKWRQKNL